MTNSAYNLAGHMFITQKFTAYIFREKFLHFAVCCGNVLIHVNRNILLRIRFLHEIHHKPHSAVASTLHALASLYNSRMQTKRIVYYEITLALEARIPQYFDCFLCGDTTRLPFKIPDVPLLPYQSFSLKLSMICLLSATAITINSFE